MLCTKCFIKKLSNTTFNVIGEPIKFIASEQSSLKTAYWAPWKAIDGDYWTFAWTASRPPDRYWQGEFNVTSTVDYVTISQGSANPPNFGNIYMNKYVLHLLVVCFLGNKPIIGYNYKNKLVFVINGVPHVISWARRSVAIS